MNDKIDFKKQKIPFTQVANDVLNDPNLSFKAKGIYSYLYSKPEGWDFETNRIAKEATDGRDGIRSGVKELEEAGYLKRYKLPNGRMVYKVVFPPMTEKPSQASEPMTEKPNDGKTHSGKSRHISNKEIQVINKNTSNTSEAIASQDNHLLISEVIKLFEEVNPACKRMYGNVTQRKSCEFLIETYTFEKVSKVIAILPQTNKMSYMPSINTPLQLEQKWSQLESALTKKKQEKLLEQDKYKIAFT